MLGVSVNKAVKIFSREGKFKKIISATEIKSSEHARKLSPFVDPNNHNSQVIWVSPSFDKESNKLKKRSYFRKKSALHLKAIDIQKDENLRVAICSESEEHKKAKNLISQELIYRLSKGLALDWGFYDSEATDFLIKGNLLLGANRIAMEYPFKTSSGHLFRLDIAILGGGVRESNNKEFILVGIEIEKENTFDYRKEILCKSAGFPLISIDISGMHIEEITEGWARKVIGENLKNSQRRTNYIYIHDLLYTLFIDYPEWFFENEPHHQYIVFDNKEGLDKTLRVINHLKKSIDSKFHLNPQKISIFKKGTKIINPQQEKVLKNMGEIVGSGWQEINHEEALLVTIKRPQKIVSEIDFKIYMSFFRILLQSPSALIGYKFEPGIQNESLEDDVWSYVRLNRNTKVFETKRIAPKRLVDPLNQIITTIENLR